MKSSLKQCSTASGLLLPPSCLLGQRQPALGSALACNERQVREMFSKGRDQKELVFVPVVLPGMTADPAAAAHSASSPTLADALAVIGVRLSLTESRRFLSHKRLFLTECKGLTSQLVSLTLHLTLGLHRLSYLQGSSLPTRLVSLSTFRLVIYGSLHSFLAVVNY